MKKMKYYLWLILLLLIAVPVFAEPQTKDRNQEENYGVNKHWKITDQNRNNVLRTPYVDANEKIYDFSGVLTEEEISTLKEKLTNFTEKHNMEIVILIQSLPYLNDSANEDYAADFYDYNDFGLNVENNSGILLFRNTYEQDPYYDMYTFGNAQLYFDQSRYDHILDGIYDNLHAGNYLQGFSDFIDKTDSWIDAGKPYALENYYVDKDGYLRKYPNHYTIDKDGNVIAKYQVPWMICLIISGTITLIVMIILISKNKMVKKATQAEEYLLKSNTHITNRQDQFMHTHTTSYTVSHDSGGGGGGGFSSHSGSSGGGHSSGGGRHG